MRYIIFTIFISLFLSLTLGYTSSNPTFYLNPLSICKSDCGSEDQPFSNFKDAINYLSSLKSETPLVLLVDQGDYYGENNQQITIDFNLEIRSIYESDETVLDCQDTTFAFKALGQSTLLIKGLLIKNCVSYKGGAVYTENKSTTLQNLKFISNFAQAGAAIYSAANVLDIESCVFINNKGVSSSVEISKSITKLSKSRFFNNSGRDISCSQTSVDSSESFFTSACFACEMYDQDLSSLCNNTVVSELNDCNRDGVCDSFIETHDTCPYDCSDENTICNSNGICEPLENFKNCPSDCLADLHPGWKLEKFEYEISKPNRTYTNYPNPVDVEFLGFPSILDFMGKQYPPLSGKLSSNIAITETTNYYFQLSVSNLAAIAFIDGRVLFDNFFKENINPMVLERKLLLSSQRKHFIEIYFIVSNDFQRNLELRWKKQIDEEYTLIPSAFITLEETIECGDGICNEEPTTCLIDCHDQFEPDCSPTSPAPPLQSYYYPVQDMVGTLLNTQYLSTLPGMKYLSQGIDLETWKSKPTSIFAHTYCDDTSFSLAHFVYRDAVYTIPKGLHAQISPTCTSDSTTKVFSSSYSFAKNSAEEWGVSVSLSGGLDLKAVSFKASASFSKHESVKKAEELEKQADGSLYQSTIVCDVFKINMVEPYRWNPRFLEDIGSAYVDDKDPEQARNKTTQNLVQVVKNYGSGFYKSATLGGKLEQLSVVDNSYEKSSSSQETESNHDWSFSASVSKGIFKGSAKYHGSIENKKSSSQMQEFVKNSKRSTLTISGGAPGSYGEDEPNAFETWADSLDKLPVPIEGEVRYVADILPTNWYFKNNISVKDLWADAELLIFKDIYKQAKFKYTDPSDPKVEYLIDHLGKNQGLYVLIGKDEIEPSEGCLKEFSSLTIDTIVTTNYTPENTLVAVFIKGKKAKHILIGAEINDDQGIRAMTFRDAKGDAIKMCEDLQFISMSTTRQYNLTYDNNLSKYVSAAPVFESLHLQYENMKITPDCTFCTVEMTIIGTEGRQTDILGAVKSFSAHLQPTMYIGDIIGITFNVYALLYEQRVKNTPQGPILEPVPSNVDITFTSIMISQTCPKEREFGCIPDKVIQDDTIGYIKTYELWRLPSRSTTSMFSFSLNHTQNAYYAIDPFGI
ncbi:hypothetical protein CYY_007468 [Polysphondylium violaceum]|uniref:MACPF domain-containing protein n=1 Tax=Polysphondylium violaceum TaxID=133409 RepID=A0A8J4PX88_9MYCE|nr:hypothetical protein CYY_007468 [Polysphondylium violaceum]